jgi:hypothetical protein
MGLRRITQRTLMPVYLAIQHNQLFSKLSNICLGLYLRLLLDFFCLLDAAYFMAAVRIRLHQTVNAQERAACGTKGFNLLICVI